MFVNIMEVQDVVERQEYIVTMVKRNTLAGKVDPTIDKI